MLSEKKKIRNSRVEKAENFEMLYQKYVNRRTLRRASGQLQVKPRRKKEQIEEKKRCEKKIVLPRIDLGLFDTPNQSFTTRPRGTHMDSSGNFIIKTIEFY